MSEIADALNRKDYTSITEALSQRTPLSFERLRATNVRRCIDAYHPTGVDEWTPTDWACALAGEAGEVCNEVKKLRRLGPTPETIENFDTACGQLVLSEAKQKIADELADVVIYADLLAERLGIHLCAALVRKFNEVSERVGTDVRL